MRNGHSDTESEGSDEGSEGSDEQEQEKSVQFSKVKEVKKFSNAKEKQLEKW